jgi:hypothetical protein
MNSGDYLKEQADKARGEFLKAYFSYQDTFDFELYGPMQGAMLVFERLSGDSSGELWDTARSLYAYLIENNLPTK